MGHLVSFPIFTFFLGLYLIGILIGIYYTFFKGRFGPITRKAEIEEHMAKMGILDSHGKKPEERNRKYKLFGWFSYIPDEFKETEFDEVYKDEDDDRDSGFQKI